MDTKRGEYKNALRSKALIRKAFLDLFEEKPFDKISVTDIVKRADINRGTFYLHYKDVSGVLEQIALSIVDELADKLNSLDIQSIIKNPEEAFVMISEFLEKDYEFYKKLISLDHTGFALNQAILRGEKYIKAFPEEFLSQLGEHPEIVMNYILAGSLNVYCHILVGASSLSLKEAPSYLGRFAREVMMARLG